MSFKQETTPIPGCFLLSPVLRDDDRGRFVKLFHEADFRHCGMPFVPAETFATYSHPGVIRGLHFQTPPFDHDKLVTCMAGKVWDVLLDLRVGSPKFGCHYGVWLDANQVQSLFIPRGVAHGFCTTVESAILMYMVSSAHEPAHDQGVRWDSAGINWPLADAPCLSERDQNLPPLMDFDSPFMFSPEQGS